MTLWGQNPANPSLHLLLLSALYFNQCRTWDKVSLFQNTLFWRFYTLIFVPFGQQWSRVFCAAVTFFMTALVFQLCIRRQFQQGTLCYSWRCLCLCIVTNSPAEPWLHSSALLDSVLQSRCHKFPLSIRARMLLAFSNLRITFHHLFLSCSFDSFLPLLAAQLPADSVPPRMKCAELSEELKDTDCWLKLTAIHTYLCRLVMCTSWGQTFRDDNICPEQYGWPLFNTHSLECVAHYKAVSGYY